jgi:antitoxin component YwqK of YwqJK toxin-antitoxin module
MKKLITMILLIFVVFCFSGCTDDPEYYDTTKDSIQKDIERVLEEDVTIWTLEFKRTNSDDYKNVKAIGAGQLNEFLETHLGFIDPIDTSELEQVKVISGDDESNYYVGYLDENGELVGWSSTTKNDEWGSMTYRLPQYGEICYVYYDKLHISTIDFRADGYETKIYFGDTYVENVVVSKDSGANSESTAYYKNGNIKAITLRVAEKKRSTFGYYKNGNMEHQIHYNQQELLQGTIKYYYEDEQLKSETDFIAGNRQGLHSSWYENGDPKEVYIFKNDKQHGDQFYYDKEGNLFSTHYIDGEKQDKT